MTLRRRRDTGPDRATRALVWDREGGCCAACGRGLGYGGWYSIQHRVARGSGGGNAITNLILLCGSATSCGCHRLCEDRDNEMHDRGFWLYSTEDPAAVPVHLWTPQRGIQWAVRWLTPAGGYTPDPPGGETA